MANEITVIKKSKDNRYNLLFYYPINTPIQVSSGVNVKVGSSDSIPDLVLSVFSTEEKDALDNSEAALETVIFRDASAMNPAQVLAKAQALYAVKKASWLAAYNFKYARTGQRFNAS